MKTVAVLCEYVTNFVFCTCLFPRLWLRLARSEEEFVEDTETEAKAWEQMWREEYPSDDIDYNELNILPARNDTSTGRPGQ